MSYSAKILLDSISETGKRLTTFEITFPRCVLAEAETHRVLRGWDGNIEELVIHNLGVNVDENLSRNSASSRAIPISKMVQRVRENPFIPEKWGMPVRGMGAKEYYDKGTIEDINLTMAWKFALKNSLEQVEACIEFGNKEDLNRLLEPFMWHTAIITATEFDNFFKLRTNSAADWKIRRIADLMYEAYHAFENWGKQTNIKDCIHGEIKVPQKLKVGEWHCPLVYEEDINSIKYMIDVGGNFVDITPVQKELEAIEWMKRISVARCARVSYLTHDGKRDIEKDLELFERLRTSGHWSPFEHVATPYFQCIERDYLHQKNIYEDLRSGNFIGWKQMRKEFADENCTNFRKEN